MFRLSTQEDITMSQNKKEKTNYEKVREEVENLCKKHNIDIGEDMLDVFNGMELWVLLQELKKK